MNNKLRWGILGTGTVAERFAIGLQQAADSELVAIGSRSKASAATFAEKFSVAIRYSSYKGLIQDTNVDVIYVATPHCFHMENTLSCLKHGKSVLCEKPFAINAQQAELMIRTARENKVFLMEAMWSRFLPSMRYFRDILAQGVIGEVLQLTADFGFYNEFNPQHRLFDPDMGGGALLDIGVYPVSFASMVLGTPESIQSRAHIGQSGVDENAGIVLSYPDSPALGILSLH
jgi:predicted dehydrogenase